MQNEKDKLPIRLIFRLAIIALASYVTGLSFWWCFLAFIGILFLIEFAKNMIIVILGIVIVIGISLAMLFGLIALFAAIYSLFSWHQARIAGKTFNYILGATGYGFIPLVLGGFLAVYFEMFIAGAWRFIPLVLSVFGFSLEAGHRILSREATMTLQHLIITGGLLASLYATYRMIKHYMGDARFSLKFYGLPYVFLLGSGTLFLLAL